jgi:hypothetical protein
MEEASVLAQLRTGIARLNGYLHRIREAPTDQCTCNQATERWIIFSSDADTGRHCEKRCFNARLHAEVSFYLGGKTASDDKTPTPDLEAVRSMIRFAIETGRLDATGQASTSQSS